MNAEKTEHPGFASRPMGSGEFASLMLLALLVAPLALHFIAGLVL